MKLDIELDQLDRLEMEEITLFLKGQIERRTEVLRNSVESGGNAYGPMTKAYAYIKRTKIELAQLRILHNRSLKW